MRRRAYLSTGGAILLTSLTGCLGRKVVSNEDWERKNRRLTEVKEKLTARQTTIQAQQQTLEKRQNTVNAKEQTITELNDEITAKENTINDLESDLSARQAEIDSLESRVDRLDDRAENLVKEDIFDWYDVGYDFKDIALGDYNAAQAEGDEGDWAIGSMLYARANGEYRRAERMFKEARDQASLKNYQTVEDYADSSMNYCKHIASAALDYANAYNRYSFGETAAGDSDIRSGNDDFDRAQDYEVREPSLVQSALDL